VSELHKFIFEGMPVRGMLVRLTDAWQTILARRAANTATGPYPAPVRELLGEMAAAGVLMQGNIKFNGALVLQIAGDGPLKVAVVEVQSDLRFRATCTQTAAIADDARLSEMVNLLGQGRCAITLDPQDRLPGQQPYQGVVPLWDDRGEKLEHIAEVIEHYMLQSEQLDTVLVLAASEEVAAGLLIQRLPVEGEGNLQGQADSAQREALLGRSEDFNRIALLARSLQREELLTLEAESILHRLFWDEPLARFEPLTGERGPRFACTCSRERVRRMLRSLGAEEVQSILAEQGQVEVGCEFCGAQYRFDPVDAAQVFTDPVDAPGADGVLH
jgi:molecular chaperone Hsp33